ncbi:universal stress protein [Photobacterium leiognathi]|uniref:Universal stress protein n=3 Tax=Photobacterium leiognathi TaxID=553611 RepID=A0A0U1P9A6_PHOLE|nr:universal stress protein [Photobacterium leiognathi]KJF85898.1 universal stress global response regulator UspA [Photobacterium leiognathi]MCG3885294.1 universal stress protein [Photobacterium leiognathi]PHZ59536.1 universal stress global response regulator UspA [Photobacterium leiognathi]PSU99512.1 universal stress global response regulator UspA [Photobacterium leiognathi subsp. mandapamensis]PSV12393.1 universal stress global response regulator UspA [Photobacterium leiognathi subsp. mandap
MVYKHILAAIDLSEDSEVLVHKAALLAKALDAKLSLIHIDVDYADLYTGLIDINLAEMHERAESDAQMQLHRLAQEAHYPVAHTLVGSGDLSEEICNAIKNMDIDLVICGHHQDFWSKILSSTRQLLSRTPVDLLMVPLK